jgi:hypothetical protein
MNEQHEMILEKMHPSGTEEWYCPTCGRRMLLNYGPRFTKEILEAGNESAVHSGGKGGLRMGAMQLMPVDRSPTEDARLAAWEAWLDEMGFDDLWNTDIQ